MKKLTLSAVACVCLATLGVASAALGSSGRHAAAAPQVRVAQLSRALVRSAHFASAVEPLRRRVSGITQTFTDPAGDNGPGADVTGVVVNADTASLGFLIQLPTTAQLGPDDVVTLVLDSDTDDSNGYFGVGISGSSDGSVSGALLEWDGTAFTQVSSSLQVTFQANSGLTLALPRTDVGLGGSTPSFNFAVGTYHGNSEGDLAPTSGWFTMPLPAGVSTTTAATTTASTTTAATTTTVKPKAKPKPKPKCVKWGKKHGKRVCLRHAKPKRH